jgi:hypothetical protein
MTEDNCPSCMSALEPVLPEIRDVLNRAHQRKLAALGPISPQDMLLHLPQFRVALDTITDDGQALMRAIEELWSHLSQLMTTPTTPQPEGYHNGEPQPDHAA